MSDCSFRVEKLSLRNGSEQRLQEISFALHSGEVLGISGPNGSGKTSLLKCMAGIERPSTGALHYPRGAESFRIAYMPQQLHMEIDFPVERFLELSFWSTKFTQEVKSATWAELVDALALENLLEKFFSKLSLGQKQRVLFAATLLQKPSLYLLDEPTSSVDENWHVAFIELLRAELRRDGVMILLASHDRDLLQALDATTLELQQGRPKALMRVHGVS